MEPNLPSTPSPSPAPQITPEPAVETAAAFSDKQRELAPKIAIEIVSMREVIETMPERDRRQFEALVAEDPNLEEARELAVNMIPGSKDLSVEVAEKIAENFAQCLSAEARPALNVLVDFYLGYLRPFPDITETEPLESLLGYLRDNPNWDALMAQSKETGKIIGSCSGQVVDVPCELGDFSIGWNEHTWVDKDARRSGVGQIVAGLFADKASRAGAIGVVIETDNPYLITEDPRAFNHADPEARGHFWTSMEDGLGQSMDPFKRFLFWGGQEFGVICSGEPATPIPYSQISMDLGVVGSCETINLAFKPLADEYRESMPKEMYIAALVALQNTIDENSKAYPELVRTLKEIEEAPGDTLHFVKLTDPNIKEVMERGKESKVGAAERDYAYCEEQLRTNLSAESRNILTQTKAYLKKELNIPDA